METAGGIRAAVTDGSARDEYTVTIGLEKGAERESLSVLLETDDTIEQDLDFDMYEVTANGATLRRLFSEEPDVIEFIEPASAANRQLPDYRLERSNGWR